MAITTTTDVQATNSATPTLDFGFTASAGDLIICLAGKDGNGTVTWPGSWVEIKDAAHTGGVAFIAYLIAAGGETSVVPTATVSERWEVIFVRIPTGEWHGTTAPEISTGATGSGTSPDPDSLSPSWGAVANTIAIATCFRDDSVANTVTGWPTGYDDNQTDINSTASAQNVACAIDFVNSTSIDPGAFTISASETWAAYTIAVRPVASSGTTVTPTTASLVLTTFAPTVSVSNNQLVTPTTASLSLTTFAPTVTASDHKTVTPTTAALTLTTFAPSVNIGVNVVPTTLALTLTTFAPTVSVTNNQTVTPTTAALSLTTFAPTVTASDHKTVTPTTASLSLTGFAPTVTASDHKVVTPTTAALTLTAFAPTVSTSDNQVVTPTTLALALTGYAPTVTASDHRTVTPSTASLVLTGYAPSVITAVFAIGQGDLDFVQRADGSLGFTVRSSASLDIQQPHEATLTTMALEYDLNDSTRPTVTFTVSDVATDPTTVTLTVIPPDKTPLTYTYAGATITKSSTGVYYKDISLNQRGIWYFRFVGTGACEAAVEGTVTVRA